MSNLTQGTGYAIGCLRGNPPRNRVSILSVDGQRRVFCQLVLGPPSDTRDKAPSSHSRSMQWPGVWCAVFVPILGNPAHLVPAYFSDQQKSALRVLRPWLCLRSKRQSTGLLSCGFQASRWCTRGHGRRIKARVNAGNVVQLPYSGNSTTSRSSTT